MGEEQIRDQVMNCIDYSSYRDAIGLIEKYNVDVNKPDSNSCFFLNVAARNNNIKLVTYLLKKGARPDVRDGTGLTALEWADETPKILELLQEALRQTDSVEPSSNMYANMDEEQIRDEVMFCIDYSSSSDAIGLIEKYKVDVNKPDSNGSLFLNVATRDNKIPLVSYLLKKKAKPDVKDASGLTALEGVETPKMREVFQETLKQNDSEEPSSNALSMRF